MDKLHIIGYEGGRGTNDPVGWGAAAIVDETDPEYPMLRNGISGFGSQYDPKDVDKYVTTGTIMPLPYWVPVASGMHPVVLDLNRKSAYVRYLIVDSTLDDIDFKKRAGIAPKSCLFTVENDQAFYLFFEHGEQFDQFVAKEVRRIFRFVVSSAWMDGQCPFPYAGQIRTQDINSLISTAEVLSCHSPWTRALSALKPALCRKAYMSALDAEQEICLLRNEQDVKFFLTVMREAKESSLDLAVVLRTFIALLSGTRSPEVTDTDKEGCALLEMWRQHSVRMFLESSKA